MRPGKVPTPQDDRDPSGEGADSGPISAWILRPCGHAFPRDDLDTFLDGGLSIRVLADEVLNAGEADERDHA